MDNSTEIYEELLALISRSFPELADQIQAAVSESRSDFSSQLSPSDDERYAALIEDARPPVPATSETITPYSGDERLAILVRAIRTFARTMVGSRYVLMRFASIAGLRDARIVFEGSEGDIDLGDEVRRSYEVLGRMEDILAPIMEELSEWR